MTSIYIMICFVVFLYINFKSGNERTYTAIKLGAFYPYRVKEYKEYWRMITCHFIHIDFFHFIMNAYALYNLGIFLETLMGTLPYLYLCLMSMIFGCLMTMTLAQINSNHDHTITIGASCVVYGFFGAIVVLGLIYPDFASLLADFASVIIINFAYTFLNPQISKTGHLGGFIGGMLATVILILVKVI